MCQVCVAEQMIESEFPSEFDGIMYIFRAEGKAEGKARYQFKRENEEWGKKWLETDDLASLAYKLGLMLDDEQRLKRVGNKPYLLFYELVENLKKE